jgi:hypothetical protein
MVMLLKNKNPGERDKFWLIGYLCCVLLTLTKTTDPRSIGDKNWHDNGG